MREEINILTQDKRSIHRNNVKINQNEGEKKIENTD